MAKSSEGESDFNRPAGEGQRAYPSYATNPVLNQEEMARSRLKIASGLLTPDFVRKRASTFLEQFWNFFFPGLTGMVGFWATLSLNIPDFTRYAKSQRAQIVGQAIALPPSMTAFAFVGVIVTSATAIVYGKTIWDPVVLAGKFDSPILVTFAMLAVLISTLATNIAANITAQFKIDFSRG